MVEGTPPGDALPPAPQRATPARKGASCGAGAGSPRPHRPHPGHRGRGTPAARSKGRAAGGGTAPDTRRPSQRRKALPPPPQRAMPARKGARCGAGRGTAPDTRCPSQRWWATPPGDGPPPAPRHAAPTGHVGQGDRDGPPQPHARARSTWVADPNSPPSGRAVGEGTAPDLRRPSQRWKAPPPGTPFRQPHSEQRRPARAHAVGPVLDPHVRTHRTRNTRLVVPRLPAPEDGRSGEGQRLTPDAPRNSGRPPPLGDGPPSPPRHAAPTGHAGQEDSVGPPHPHTHAHSTWVADSPKPGRGEPGPDRPPQARQMEQGTGAGHAEWHGPRGTDLPAPSAGTARGAHATPPRAGGSGRRGSASAHTRKGHAGTTRRATGRSSQNAETAWNGVPASEGKGHPDGTTGHTQRGTRGAGRGKRERHKRRAHTDGALHPPKAVVAHCATPQPPG